MCAIGAASTGGAAWTGAKLRRSSARSEVYFQASSRWVGRPAARASSSTVRRALSPWKADASESSSALMPPLPA